MSDYFYYMLVLGGVEQLYFQGQLAAEGPSVALGLLLQVPDEHALDVLDVVGFGVVAHVGGYLLVIDGSVLVDVQGFHEPQEQGLGPLLRTRVELVVPFATVGLVVHQDGVVGQHGVEVVFGGSAGQQGTTEVVLLLDMAVDGQVLLVGGLLLLLPEEVVTGYHLCLFSRQSG